MKVGMMNLRRLFQKRFAETVTKDSDFQKKSETKIRNKNHALLGKEKAQWKKTEAVKFFQGYADEDRIYDDL